MDALDEAQFEAAADDFDAAVFASGGIDPFCSSTDWILPAHRGLIPGREVVCARNSSRWCLFARRTLEDGMRLLEPLEASWALASPFIGVDDPAAGQDMVAWLAGVPDWDVAVIAGLYQGSPALEHIARTLTSRFQVRVADSTPRYIVSLANGVDAYLAGRSRNFRRTLVKAEARARRAGVVIEPDHAGTGADGERVFERLLAVERRSWKGQAEVGIDQGRMREFYRLMSRRLAAGGRHRCWFATLDGLDIGYVLGAVRGSHYRGLQFSYDRRFGKLSLGNALQVVQMRALHGEGVTHYDLGSEAHYKERWADRVDASPLLFAFRN